MDRGAWWATVHGVAKNQTRLKRLSNSSNLSDSATWDGSPTGSSVHRISQERIPEWFTIPFSRGTSQSRYQTQISCIAGRYFYHLSHHRITIEWLKIVYVKIFVERYEILYSKHITNIFSSWWQAYRWNTFYILYVTTYIFEISMYLFNIHTYTYIQHTK